MKKEITLNGIESVNITMNYNDTGSMDFYLFDNTDSFVINKTDNIKFKIFLDGEHGVTSFPKKDEKKTNRCSSRIYTTFTGKVGEFKSTLTVYNENDEIRKQYDLTITVVKETTT